MTTGSEQQGDAPTPWPRHTIERIGAYLRLRLQPARNDSRHNDPSVLPGQTDVPAGASAEPLARSRVVLLDAPTHARA